VQFYGLFYRIMTTQKFDFFIGPCVIESEELCLEIADFLVNSVANEKFNITFKASFDKANRSNINSFRGPGIDKGLEILAKVKAIYGLPILTDIHLPSQADEVAQVVDVVQIPAFLCRQTDLIIAASKACNKYNCTLKIKKGQFISPSETKNIIGKTSAHLPLEKIMLTERGTSFGYNQLVVDMSSFATMKSFGVRTIHDATHCVQRPGAMGAFTGGNNEAIIPIARAAVASGADGVFMEAHPNPEKALSDKTTILDLKKIPALTKELVAIHELVCNF